MSKKNKYVLFEITPEIEHFAELCEKNTTIDKELYAKYEVCLLYTSPSPRDRG